MRQTISNARADDGRLSMRTQDGRPATGDGGVTGAGGQTMDLGADDPPAMMRAVPAEREVPR